LKRHLRWLFAVVGATGSLLATTAVALLLSLVLALVVWLPSEGSLAQAFDLLGRWLPAGQQLQVQGVQGSVQQGGQIGHLRWQGVGLTVEARDVHLAWDLPSLWQGRLQVDGLQVAALRVQDQRPSGNSPWEPWGLPLEVALPFRIERLEWAGTTRLQLQGLQGQYRFDGQAHHLRLDALPWAQGVYAVEAELQAQAPGRLQARARGPLQATQAGRNQALALQAEASLNGVLYGADAELRLAVEVKPATAEAHASTPAQASDAERLQLQARVRPAAAQPLDQVEAEWRALDLASLWPQALHTRLSGSARVRPAGSGWTATVAMRNALEGPLDQQRLPLRQAQGQLVYRDGGWQVEAVEAEGAGGRLQASGQWLGQGGQVRATLQGLHPESVHRSLVGPVLDGLLEASYGPEGIRFTLEALAAGSGTLRQALAAAPMASTQGLQAQGLWQDGVLTVEGFRLAWADARLQGHFRWDARNRADPRADTQAIAHAAPSDPHAPAPPGAHADPLTGQVEGELPGASLRLDGSMAARSGQGQAQAHVRDAQALSAWLAHLPGLSWASNSLPTLQGGDGADLSLQWQGGWSDLAAVQLDGRLSVPHLVWHGDRHLRDAELRAKGTFGALQIQGSGAIAWGAAQASYRRRCRCKWHRPHRGRHSLRSCKPGCRTACRPSLGPWN